MTIDAHCLVCKNPDRRRGVELMWNGGMTQAAISRVVGDAKLTSHVVTKHLKEHADGDASARQVDIEPELPVRERVLALQRMQLDEIERQIALAQHRADLMNAERAGKVDAEGKALPLVDWSDFLNILNKDMQAAIGSILKAQGLTDKREAKHADLKLGLFEAMSKAGLAPKAISGQNAISMIQSGGDDERPEVPEVWEQEPSEARSGGEER